ncbi:MAG: cyclodeaminase/cyclohydrolase family protein [Gammaproteobacteria bacterium]
MSETTKTRDARLADFLRELSSENGRAGSGAAGGIALALAAACAAKAAAITLKHAPANSRLHEARGQLLAHIDSAIEGSDDDTERFAQYLHHRSLQAAQNVISADERLLSLVDELAAVLEALDPQIRQNVTGDLVAARALSTAARAIQVENIAELRKLTASGSEQ